MKVKSKKYCLFVYFTVTHATMFASNKLGLYVSATDYSLDDLYQNYGGSFDCSASARYCETDHFRVNLFWDDYDSSSAILKIDKKK